MKRVGLEVSPKTLVRELSVAQKQLVEIAKAISNHVKVLVLDEPTAAITDKETNMLFGIIRELQKEKNRNCIHFPPHERVVRDWRQVHGHA